METKETVSYSISLNKLYHAMFSFSPVDALLLLFFMLSGAVLHGAFGAIVGTLIYILLYITTFVIFIPFGAVLFYFLGMYYLNSLHTFLYLNNYLLPYAFIFLIGYYIVFILTIFVGAVATIAELGIIFDMA
jgi:hypothetical protein